MGAVKPKVELMRHTEQPEQTIALAAKLCYSGSDIVALEDKIGAADTGKFIAMLLSLGHLSAFEHASFTFGIEGVSRALLAQITRHRIASFSVQSQRYVDMSRNFGFIVPQGIEELGESAVAEFEAQMAQMHEWYCDWQARLGAGEAANQDARFVLPNAAETKMIVTMNARELLHFFGLRCCNRAQWELRAVAWKMLERVKEVAPNIFFSAGPSCVSGRCSEGKMTCGTPYQPAKRD